MIAPRHKILAALALLVAAWLVPAAAAADGPAAGLEPLPTELAQLLAQNQKHICLKNCMEKYGADKKKTCALECGLAKGAMGRKRPDCAAAYKACMKSCGKEKACKKGCRAARRNCV